MNTARRLIILGLLLSAGCGRRTAPSATGGGTSLAQLRASHPTQLLRQERDTDPIDPPPAGMFNLVRYTSPAGSLAAYLTPDPRDGKKRPAIIWIFGGFSNGIGDTAWKPASSDDDQSARAFREAGIVMMYPSLRGGVGNPGLKEGFYGEVDDVVAAAKYLASLSYVDPKRIYLGGHSTGGTLALLTAESTGGFRAVFALGPVEEARGYGQENVPFDVNNAQEAELRAPMLWLNSINRPTFVFEGDGGNSQSLRNMASANRNPVIQFYEVPNTDHFANIAKVTPVLARQILADTAPEVHMSMPGTQLPSGP